MSDIARSFSKNSLILVAIFLAYLVTAYLGSFFALSDSHSITAIWPPAGIAAAAVLIWGWRTLVPIFIAAFISGPLMNASDLSLSVFYSNLSWLNLTIAVGVVLQAAAVKYLVEKCLKPQNPLIDRRSILLFLLIAGPVCSMISSVIGIAAMFMWGMLSVDQILFSWLTCWVGSMIGVIIFASMLLVIFSGSHRRWSRRKWIVALPLILLYLIFSVFFLVAKDLEIKQQSIAFKASAEAMSRTILHSIDGNESALKGLQSFYNSSNFVDYAEFKKFVGPYLNKYKSLKILEWMPKVKSADLAAFPQQLSKVYGRQILLKSFNENNKLMLKPSSDSLSFPVLYLYPMANNEKAIGLDPYSSDSRRHTMRLAARTGKTFSTDPYPLVQAKDQTQHSVWSFAPVYEKGAKERSMKTVKGFLVSIFSLQGLLSDALPGETLRDFNLVFSDSDRKHFYVFDGERVEQIKDASEIIAAAPYSVHIDLNIGNRAWHFDFIPSKVYLTEHAVWISWAILLSGLVFTCFISFMLLTLSAQDLLVRRKVREQTEEIDHLAFFDGLTNLANRHAFYLKIEPMLKQAKKMNQKVGLFYIDVDNFKMINDAYGHHAGDEALKVFSGALMGLTRKDDFVARIGGDEFILVSTDIEKLSDSQFIANRIVESLDVPIQFADTVFKSTVSVGVSVYPDHANDIESLLKNADIALYFCKGDGGNGYNIFSEILAEKYTRKLDIIRLLPEAIHNAEIDVVFQPIISAKSEEIVSVEALARWESPVLGKVSPDEFISISEQSMGIIPLGHYLFEKSLKNFESLSEASGGKIKALSVNISALQLVDESALSSLMKLLEVSEVSPEQLTLEITETAFIENYQAAADGLKQIRDAGIKLALDDFGAGYSSLSYLQDIPADFLKIDAAFVRCLEGSESSQAIVSSVIKLAQSLSLKTVAEGVETIGQANILREMGCDTIQGFYFYKPMSVEQLKTLFKKNLNQS